MAITSVSKAILGVDDISFDSDGTGKTFVQETSKGTTRANSKVNASHIPVSSTTRANAYADGVTATTKGDTDVDAVLNQLMDHADATGIPDNDTLEVSSNVLQVKALGIDTAELKANAVTTAKILDANVTNAKLAPASGTAAVAGSASGASGTNGLPGARHHRERGQAAPHGDSADRRGHQSPRGLHQRRHLHQWVDAPELVEIAPDRQFAVVEIQPEEFHADSHPPDEG